MKLYFHPGACSLAPHIILRETAQPFILEKVDGNGRTTNGLALAQVNGKMRVPVLELDGGERLTETPVILQFLADRRPEAGLIPSPGTMDRYRVLEWLNFITSELHKSFFPLFRKEASNAEWRKVVERQLGAHFDWLCGQLSGKRYLMGERFCVADAYLFVILSWTSIVGIDLEPWPELGGYVTSMRARHHVFEALKAEMLVAAAA